MDLEGISNACTTNVMMNKPVTKTAAIEAINSSALSSRLALGFFPAGGSAVAIAAEPLSFFKFSFCEAAGFEGRLLTGQPHHAFPADGVPNARRPSRQTCQFTNRFVRVWRRQHPLEGKVAK